MEFRKATAADVPHIMDVVTQAQAYLAAQGIDQWQDGYPTEAVIREDIRLGQGLVLAEDGQVLGIAAVVFGAEPSYARIYDGAWKTPEPYGAIHRVAVTSARRGSGLADAVMRGAEDVIRAQGITSARIDTHRQNIVMQRMLARNGYTACGVIYIEGSSEHGAERIALEKVL